jgi:hypothetical protein
MLLLVGEQSNFWSPHTQSRIRHQQTHRRRDQIAHSHADQNNPEEPALIGDAINTAFTVNASLDIYAAAISGSGGTVNVVLTIIFAILFFAMGAR